MHNPNIKHLIPSFTPVSLLIVDAETTGERLQVFNRTNGKLLAHRKIKTSNFNVFLPANYALVSDLMCLMLDDNAEFNAAIVDHVKPIAIDLVTFDPTNPQPYEP